jgi:hemin uptake protein HemP
MNKLPSEQTKPTQQQCCEGPGDIPTVESRNLFGASNRLVIKHGNGHYLLQITRQGKLILTR